MIISSFILFIIIRVVVNNNYNATSIKHIINIMINKIFFLVIVVEIIIKKKIREKKNAPRFII